MFDNNEEMFPIVDEEGNITGAATRKECHSGSKLLHPVVHLHVFNDKGELYLQKRPAWKDIQPNKWDTSVGGHIDLGESVEMALKREAQEELGISDYPICIAKTQYSFSADPKAYNLIEGFELKVRDIVINKGAEMIVVIMGDIMRMPGLPKEPQAKKIDIVNGLVEGLS